MYIYLTAVFALSIVGSVIDCVPVLAIDFPDIFSTIADGADVASVVEVDFAVVVAAVVAAVTNIDAVVIVADVTADTAVVANITDVAVVEGFKYCVSEVETSQNHFYH